MAKGEKKQNKASFAAVSKIFVDRVASIEITFPVILEGISKRRKTSAVALEDFIKKVEKRGDKKGEIRIKEKEEVNEFEKIIRNFHRNVLADRIIPESLFIALVSQFDNLLRDLLKVVYKNKPEILGSSDKQISVAELLKLKSIEDARNIIIEKEIDNLLRDSHSSHISKIESLFGIELKNNQLLWGKFIEVTERRNIFVHSDGLITNQYLQVCKKHACALEDKCKSGMRLHVTKDYFSQAVDVILEMGIKMTQEVWRKIEKNEIDRADHFLMEIIVDQLRIGRNEIAKNLAEFGIKKGGKSTEENNIIFLINKALALKQRGEEKEAKRVINEKDWSAVRGIFKMAAKIIVEDYKGAADEIRKFGKEDKKWLSEEGIKMPILDTFKKRKEFTIVYREVFGENPIFKTSKSELKKIKEI